MKAKSMRMGPLAVLGLGLVLHAAFCASLLTGFLDPLFVEAQQGHGQASDFFGIYQAGSNLTRGYSIYDSPDYRREAPQVVPYYYFYRYLPPTAYGASLLVRIMPPWPAYWAWVVWNEVLIALIVAALLRDRRWPLGRRAIIAGMWLGAFPFYIEQFMGQFSFTMAALLYLLWRLDREPPPAPVVVHRPPVSAREWGVITTWAASAVLKSYSALFAIPFLRDRLLRRIALGACAGLAVTAPYFLLRPVDLQEFLRLNFTPFMAVYKGAFGLQTALRDFATTLSGGTGSLLLPWIGRPLALDRLLPLAAAAVVLLLALWATRRWDAASERRTLDIALWTTVFFLVFKSIWEYHYVMMLPIVTALYLVRGSRAVLILGVWISLPTLFAAAPILAGVSSHAPLAEWPGWFRALHFAAKAMPTLLLFAWLLRVAWTINRHPVRAADVRTATSAATARGVARGPSSLAPRDERHV